MGEFQKRIRVVLSWMSHKKEEVSDREFLDDNLIRIVEEAKKEFPWDKICYNIDDTMLALNEWFEKWFS